jgi:hypothetical protein
MRNILSLAFVAGTLVALLGCGGSPAGGSVTSGDLVGQAQFLEGEPSDTDADTDIVSHELLNCFTPDVDGDGHAATFAVQLEVHPDPTLGETCPLGSAPLKDDCRDEIATVFPGATEYCDVYDNDCDLAVNEDLDCSTETCYADDDGDGYGRSTIVSCSADNAAPVDGDCNDAQPAIHPNATEVADGLDNDCDGSTDEGILGTVWCHVDGDRDGDGKEGSTLLQYTGTVCPSGTSSNDDDCDDDFASIHPGATEGCNSIDDDCDVLIDEGGVCGATTTYYRDVDGDGFGDPDRSVQDTSRPSGYVVDDNDCDDTDGDINPDADEICNGDDDDCDGDVDDDDNGVTGQDTWYLDDDRDGYGDPDIDVQACDAPLHYVSNDNDCDDSDDTVHLTCNMVTCYNDIDGDNYGDENDSGTERTSCRADETSRNNDDCDDTDPGIHSGCGVVSPDSGTVQFCANVNGISGADLSHVQLTMFLEGQDRSVEYVEETSPSSTSDCVTTTQIYEVGDVACVNTTFTHRDPGVPVDPAAANTWYLAGCDGAPCEPIVTGIPSINGEEPAWNDGIYTDEYRSSGSPLSYARGWTEDTTPLAGQWFMATNWRGRGVDFCVVLTDVLLNP